MTSEISRRTGRRFARTFAFAFFFGLMAVATATSSFAKEKGVKFEFRPTYYSLCG